jgi:hypothetical protein
MDRLESCEIKVAFQVGFSRKPLDMWPVREVITVLWECGLE